VDTVELLVTLFGVQTQYTALKTTVQETGLKVSAMFWALLETHLKLHLSVHRVHLPNARPIPTEEGLN
jgi:hypothetical protein